MIAEPQTAATRSEFPPRSDLPPGIAIESVPFLGTTWYERRLRYWLRRAGFAFVTAILVLTGSGIVWGVLAGIRRSSHVAFYVALPAEAAYSLATLAFIAVSTAKRWNSTELWQRRGGRSSGASLGLMAQAGVGVAALFLVLASVLSFGLYLALLVSAFLPQLVWERAARLRLAETLSSRSTGAPHANP